MQKIKTVLRLAGLGLSQRQIALSCQVGQATVSDYLRMAAGIVPPEHLLLGSDAPFPLGEPDPVNFVRRALPADQAELALSKNYARLFGV